MITVQKVNLLEWSNSDISSLSSFQIVILYFPTRGRHSHPQLCCLKWIHFDFQIYFDKVHDSFYNLIYPYKT